MQFFKIEFGWKFNLRSYDLVKDYSFETERSNKNYKELHPLLFFISVRTNISSICPLPLRGTLPHCFNYCRTAPESELQVAEKVMFFSNLLGTDSFFIDEL